MIELKELRLNENRLVLKENIVTTPILPKGYRELDRDVSVQGESVVEGALYARTLEVANGPLTVKGSVFTHTELHVNTDAGGRVEFCKSVGSAGAIVCQSGKTRVIFGADINAKQVTLRNCYVAANVFADDIVLENCVVLGGVFAVKTLSLTNVVVGTFNSPSVKAARNINLLLPSAFSVEPISKLPGTILRSLALVDLGALMRGQPERERTGAITIDPDREAQRTVLADEAGNTSVLRSYSVAGRVLAADLIEVDKLQNHFLLAAGSLGAQVLRAYDIGVDVHGNTVMLTPDTISEFFFRILDGRVNPRIMDASFSIDEVVRAFGGPLDSDIVEQAIPDSIDEDGDADHVPSEMIQQVDAEGDEGEWYCEGCGTAVTEDAVVCPKCGASLEGDEDQGEEDEDREDGEGEGEVYDEEDGNGGTETYCPNCGNKVPSNAKMCSACGAALEEDD